MAITAGKYRAKATGQVVLGTSSEKKTPFVELYFQITDGDNKGGEVRWTSYFSEKSAERTIEALQSCGWQGDDVSEFADGELHGLDTNEVQVVVELEEYKDKETDEMRTSPRVQWVNKLGGYLNIKNAMPKEEAATFGEKMKGLVLKMKAKAPPASDATDFNHGENEQPKKAAGGGRKAF